MCLGDKFANVQPLEHARIPKKIKGRCPAAQWFSQTLSYFSVVNIMSETDVQAACCQCYSRNRVTGHMLIFLQHMKLTVQNNAHIQYINRKKKEQLT